MEERESNISSQRGQHHHHHQNHRGGGHHNHHHDRHYGNNGHNPDAPKTTLIVRNVPQSVTGEMIKATLELKQVFVRSCQLASTREPG